MGVWILLGGLNASADTRVDSMDSYSHSRGSDRYTGPRGSAMAILKARGTMAPSCSLARFSKSHLTNSRTMLPWSRDSWRQWMCRLLPPATSPSVTGVRPATNSIGTWHALAFMSPPRPLAVPGRVCTSTTCGLPEAQ